MTYSATSLNIQRALKAGLVLHTPVYDLPEARRFILVPPEVELEMTGQAAASVDFPARAGAGLIANFLLGNALRVSQKRRERVSFLRKREQPDLERLESMDEIWVLCFRSPGAGWRLAGRFLERDALVIFRVFHKNDIGNNYGPIAEEVTEKWQTKFGTQPPCQGNWIDGYLSGAHYDVDGKKNIGGV